LGAGGPDPARACVAPRYDPVVVCVHCMIGAMSTGAAATGARSYIAAKHFSWVTPRRMKMITATLLGSALIASSFVVSGSTPRSGVHSTHAHAVATHATR
jgi:hypothetical protein